MDREKRKQLIETAKSRGYTGMAPPRVLVTREEFFDGNDDEGSIGCNLNDHPGLDAFNAAFRIPNFLQNLFGEGALSASFIPVYARALEEAKPYLHMVPREKV